MYNQKRNLAFLLIGAILITCAFAKISPGPGELSLNYNNYAIKIPNTLKEYGSVNVFNKTNGNLIISLQVYTRILSELEYDVQVVFITEAKIEKTKLVLKNQYGYIYSIDLISFAVEVFKGKRVF